MKSLLYVPICLLAMLTLAATVWSDELADVPRLAQQVRDVSAKGENHAAAIAAAKELRKASVSALPVLLNAMNNANPLAENWLRGVIETIAARAINGGASLPLKELEAFLHDTKNGPRARRLAYELIAIVDPQAESRLIPGLIDDPSIELRRDAVALVIEQANKASKEGDKTQAIELFNKAFKHARDLEQIKLIGNELKDREQPVDFAEHLGFVMQWKIIGPFDNVDDRGWDAVYPPETSADLTAEYPGQKETVKWIDGASSDPFGIVDLNKILAKHKGAVAYAAADFVSDREQQVQLRIGCINANKVWVNGKLAAAQHVYHANIEVDQYIVPVTLKAGDNRILLKVCQNEQTEPWAQDWRFQLRVTDAIGGPIYSRNRQPVKTASR